MIRFFFIVALSVCTADGHDRVDAHPLILPARAYAARQRRGALILPLIEREICIAGPMPGIRICSKSAIGAKLSSDSRARKYGFFDSIGR